MSAGPLSGVMLITDRVRVDPAARTAAQQVTALERFLDAALDAEVDVLQIRERDLSADTLRDLVARVVARAIGAGGCTAVVVNDRADVAAAAGAHGVHLRSDGPAVARVRALGARLAVGRAVHAIGAARDPAGADWLVFGPVFATASKPGAAGAGAQALARVCAGAGPPVFALGGLTPERAAVCARAGAAGVAGISVFLPDRTRGVAGGLPAVIRDFRAALESGETDALE